MSKKRMRRATLDLNYEISMAFFYLVAALESEKIAAQTLEMQREAFERNETVSTPEELFDEIYQENR